MILPLVRNRSVARLGFWSYIDVESFEEEDELDRPHSTTKEVQILFKPMDVRETPEVLEYRSSTKLRDVSRKTKTGALLLRIPSFPPIEAKCFPKWSIFQFKIDWSSGIEEKFCQT